VYYSICGVPVLAKYVPGDTFSFDNPVKKNEASYLLSYTPLASQAEADQNLESLTGKKIPFAFTILMTSVICAAAWFGIAFLIISLLKH